jgi:hypothetical protein
MATHRLPTPGSDNGTWGDILNDFLLQAHNADGSLQDGVITDAKVASSAAIAKTKLAPGVQTSLTSADNAAPKPAAGTDGKPLKWNNTSGQLDDATSTLNATYALIPRTTTKRAVGQDELYVNVKDYGALGDGTADDSTAIQAAVTASPSGAVIFFPFGYYKIVTTITCAKPMTFLGVASGYDGSGIGSGFLTGPGINAFTVTSPSVNFRDLQFLAISTQGQANAAKTWAIKFDTGGGDFCLVERCRFNFFYYGIWFVGGQLWTVSDNVFHSISGYHMLISNVAVPDGGDQNLRGNVFQSGTSTTGTWSSGGLIGTNTLTLTTSPAITVGSTITGTGVSANTTVTAVAGPVVTLSANIAGSNATGTYTFDNWSGLAQVRQESGGGTRVVGNKFFGGAVGYQVAPTDGASTSILPMTANSFELHTFAHIYLSTGTGGANTGTFRRIVITGNQFTATKVSQAAFYCDTSAGQFFEVMFANNIAIGTTASTYFVRLAAVTAVTVTGNYFNTGLTAVYCSGGSSDVVLTPNHLTGITGTRYRWDTGGSGATSVPSVMEGFRNFTVTSTSVYFTASQIAFGQIGGCLLEVTVVGNLTGATSGAIVGTFRRLVTMATIGANPVVTTIGTDTTGANLFDMNFDVTSASVINVQIKRNTGDGGSSIQGSITVRATGSQQSLF